MRSQRGFTYLGMLLVIALVGLGLAVGSELWSKTAQRQRNEQQLWAGLQIQQAIGSYYESAPGGAKRFPQSLTDLLNDQRFPTVRRHLRQVYVDPTTPDGTWVLIRAPDGGIRGVRSTWSIRIDQAKPTDFVYVPGGQ